MEDTPDKKQPYRQFKKMLKNLTSLQEMVDDQKKTRKEANLAHGKRIRIKNMEKDKFETGNSLHYKDNSEIMGDSQ